ncbi:hypothetical protein DY000_02022069 [Brassica cretica]|uniref:Uncharacterized protein n=1 Tax=Brassica cretica TaxID=69181 RepID=A0ABQ7EEI5_BRACR|nr:hypothetical protein DY000_02022069 [Brassica cretica]
MIATLVLQRDENGDLHDPDGHLCNAVGQKLDAQGTAIPEHDTDATGAAIHVDEAARPRTLADYNRPHEYYTNRSAILSLVEQAVYQDEDQHRLYEMEFKLEELLKDQLEMTEDMNLHLDFLCKVLNGRLETLDTRVKMLHTQASQTT